jgi:cytochrome c-type biogenesis protein CcmH
MIGWLFILVFALLVLGLLWRLARLDRNGLQFVASVLLLAMAGYAWQGSPGLAGSPKRASAEARLPDSLFAQTRRDLLGQFNAGDRWLNIAEAFQREGDTATGAMTIRQGLKQNPRDAVLWIGYGNALVMHSEGMMTPAAQLAFQRAAELSPDHPAPKFFYGLALAQGGRFDEAERIWRDTLATAGLSEKWRGIIERQLEAIRQARAMGQIR